MMHCGLPPNKRLKLTGHRALQISVLPSCHEIQRFQLPGHLGRQLSREPLDGAASNRCRALGSFCEQDIVRLRRKANLKSEASFYGASKLRRYLTLPHDLCIQHDGGLWLPPIEHDFDFVPSLRGRTGLHEQACPRHIKHQPGERAPTSPQLAGYSLPEARLLARAHYAPPFKWFSVSSALFYSSFTPTQRHPCATSAPSNKRLKLTRPRCGSTDLCYPLATKPGGSSHPVIGPGSLAASR